MKISHIAQIVIGISFGLLATSIFAFDLHTFVQQANMNLLQQYGVVKPTQQTIFFQLPNSNWKQGDIANET